MAQQSRPFDLDFAEALSTLSKVLSAAGVEGIVTFCETLILELDEGDPRSPLIELTQSQC